MKRTKLTFQFVKQAFEDRGFELLSTEFTKAKDPLDYKCSCGNISKVTYDSMRRGQTCKKCASKRAGAKQAAPIGKVRQDFLDNGCVLLETTYTNCDTPMRYKCKCGKESKITYFNMKKGNHCQECGYKKTAEKCVTPYEDVVDIFREFGHTLLEEIYVNSNTHMRYICKCGNKSVTTLVAVKAGVCCQSCCQDRRENTCLEKYGVKTYLLTEDFRNKSIETLLNKYGVEHISHVPHFFEKQQSSAMKHKPFISPSGQEIMLQGYEKHIYIQLLKLYDETEILHKKSDMPVINYWYKNKKRRYYPDFYIPRDNLIIEVKSIYTYQKTIVRNMLKALATRKLEYNFETHIYEPKFGINIV